MSRFTKASPDLIIDAEQDNINQLVKEWGSARKKMKKRKRKRKDEVKRHRNNRTKKKPRKLIGGGYFSEEEEENQTKKPNNKKRVFDYVEDNALDAFEDGGNREDGSDVGTQQQPRETYVDTTSDRNMFDGESRDGDVDGDLPDMTTEDEEGECACEHLFFDDLFSLSNETN